MLDLTTDGNACFFYCLAAHFHPEKVRKTVDRRWRGRVRLKRETKNLYRRVCSSPMETFPGVTMDDMDHLEKKFNVGVQIYNVEQSNFAYLFRRANPKYADVMHHGFE